ncbi:hypothetical protein L9G73_05150, partial [Morganella morganii]
MDIITEIIFRIIAFMAELVYTALRFLGFRIAVLGTGFFLLHMFSYHPIFLAIAGFVMGSCQSAIIVRLCDRAAGRHTGFLHFCFRHSDPARVSS